MTRCNTIHLRKEMPICPHGQHKNQLMGIYLHNMENHDEPAAFTDPSIITGAMKRTEEQLVLGHDPNVHEIKSSRLARAKERS